MKRTYCRLCQITSSDYADFMHKLRHDKYKQYVDSEYVKGESLTDGQLSGELVNV